MPYRHSRRLWRLDAASQGVGDVVGQEVDRLGSRLDAPAAVQGLRDLISVTAPARSVGVQRQQDGIRLPQHLAVASSYLPDQPTSRWTGRVKGERDAGNLEKPSGSQDRFRDPVLQHASKTRSAQAEGDDRGLIRERQQSLQVVVGNGTGRN